MHNTYVTNAFSHVDSRTANVERALKDLEPLLALFAVPAMQGRMEHLRRVLQKGARLAFTLFSEPCVWQFNWDEDRLDAPESADENPFDRMVRGRKQVWGYDVGRDSVVSIGSPDADVDPAKIVVWPALLRIVDDSGQYVGEKESELCAQVYLKHFVRSNVEAVAL